MADYRLLYANMKDGIITGELPAKSFSFETALNSIGGLSATIALTDSYSIESPGGAVVPATVASASHIYSVSKTFTQTKVVPLGTYDGDNRTAYLVVTSQGSDQSSEELGAMTGWTKILDLGDGNPQDGDSPRLWAYYKDIPTGTSDFTIDHDGTGGWTLLILEGSFKTPVWSYSFGNDDTISPAYPTTAGKVGAAFGILATNGSVTNSSIPENPIAQSGAASSAPDGAYIVGELPAGISGSWTYSSATQYVQSWIIIEEVGPDPVSEAVIGDAYSFDTPQLSTMENLRPGSTAIFVERDGVVLWGGVLWTVRSNLSSYTAELGASDFMSYLERVHIYQDLLYANQDQGFIAKDLLDRAMVKSGTGLNLVAIQPEASKSRYRYYPAVERKSFGSAIQQLANVNDGFDWRFEYSYSGEGDRINTALVMSTEPIGRLTSFVFELGTNMGLLDYSLDGTAVANYAEAWGQGEGGDGHFRASFDATSLAASPLLEAIQTFSDVKNYDTLQQKADDMVLRGKDPIERVEIGTFPNSVPVIGSYEVGDRVKVRASYGYINIDGRYRIVSSTVTVDQSGREAGRLSLVPEGVFS